MSRRSTTRRGFLKTAGTTTGAAVAIPYVITSKALGDATTAPASDRIVVGGIGIGNMGSGDLGAFLGRGDVQYVAVCDVRRNWREEGKNRVDGNTPIKIARPTSISASCWPAMTSTRSTSRPPITGTRS